MFLTFQYSLGFSFWGYYRDRYSSQANDLVWPSRLVSRLADGNHKGCKEGIHRRCNDKSKNKRLRCSVDLRSYEQNECDHRCTVHTKDIEVCDAKHWMHEFSASCTCQAATSKYMSWRAPHSIFLSLSPDDPEVPRPTCSPKTIPSLPWRRRSRGFRI